MSARLSRSELAVLVDEAIELISNWSVKNMEPEDAFNLGLLSGIINSVNVGLHG